MVADIEKYFDKYGLDLKKPGQTVSRSNKMAIEELKGFVKGYEKEKRVPIYICCQATINDFIILLQKYHKDETVRLKKLQKKRVKNDESTSDKSS